MLAEWKLGGWAAMMDRNPEPDDLIVPLPPKAAARRRTRTADASNDFALPAAGRNETGDVVFDGK